MQKHVSKVGIFGQIIGLYVRMKGMMEQRRLTRVNFANHVISGACGKLEAMTNSDATAATMEVIASDILRIYRNGVSKSKKLSCRDTYVHTLDTSILQLTFRPRVVGSKSNKSQ